MSLGHLYNNIGSYKRWPSDKANHTYVRMKICYKLLYVIQRVKNIFNFLSLANIKVFGHTYVYLFAMLLLIGLSLFTPQGVFVKYK